MVSIQDFILRLSAIPESDFTHEKVLSFLQVNRVDCNSLGDYLYFSREHYTRNLIHRTSLFELIAICWEIGQKSAIHNHRGQSCWMATAYGKVQVQNFRLVRKDANIGFCELAPDARYEITPESPQEVDPTEPIHRVLNPSAFGSRAVTLHVYSKPYDICEIYDLNNTSYRDVELTNTSEFGILKAGFQAERVRL